MGIAFYKYPQYWVFLIVLINIIFDKTTKILIMKLLKQLFLFAILITITSCNLIEEDEEGYDEEEQIDDQENVILDPNTVFNGLIIEGATIIEGDAPQPIGNISFLIEETSTALVNEGFNISLNSTENIVGAYLIISDIDGNKASNYFDIPESAFAGFSEPITTNKIFNSPKITRGSDSSNIIINFLESLNAGIFCYSICVYDGNGNISQPQTVCVTIQNLGGNNSLVDYWILSRYQDISYGIDAGLNEEYCYPDTLTCSNGNLLNFNNCTTFTTFYIEFFSNGVYRLFLKETDSDINYDASTSSCTIINEPDRSYEFLSEGVWAFNEADGKLFMAEYYAYYNEYGEIYEEFYGAGNAQLLFDAPINISDNTFTLSFNYDGEQEIYTFQK